MCVRVCVCVCAFLCRDRFIINDCEVMILYYNKQKHKMKCDVGLMTDRDVTEKKKKTR